MTSLCNILLTAETIHLQYTFSLQYNTIQIWVIIVCEAIIHNKGSKCPPESMHKWTHLIMDCRTLQRFRGGCEWFVRHQKHTGEACVRVQLQLNTVGVLSVPTAGNLKGLLHPEYGLRTHTGTNFSLFWCRKHSWRLPKQYTYTHTPDRIGWGWKTEDRGSIPGRGTDFSRFQIIQITITNGLRGAGCFQRS